MRTTQVGHVDLGSGVEGEVVNTSYFAGEETCGCFKVLVLVDHGLLVGHRLKDRGENALVQVLQINNITQRRGRESCDGWIETANLVVARVTAVGPDHGEG